MAKATTKTPVKTETKKVATKKAVSAVSSTDLIVKVCQTSLAKLNQLGIEPELQSEIDWCLGSFQSDGNPIGLYQMAERSLIVFRTEQAKKTKGVTAAWLGDIEKALKGR